MKSRKKTIAAAVCMLSIFVGSVFGSMAYLTDKQTVSNTFTVGHVKITLNEAKVDVLGVKDGNTRVEENLYHLLPGHTYIKDPTIYVDAKSEDCWLFVEVINNIVDLETKESTKKIAAQMKSNGWIPLIGNGNIYVYQDAVKGGAVVPVFGNFIIDGSVTNDDLATLYANNKNKVNSNVGDAIQVTAYAVQMDGFENNAQGAWSSTFGKTTP